MSQPILTYYPTFLPNQVLTESQLNDLRDYLDQQNRLTRTRLSGTGIICGLHAAIDEMSDGEKPALDPTGQKFIRLSAGLAITTDGYLIEVSEESVYGFYKEYAPEDVEGSRDWLHNQTDGTDCSQKTIYEVVAEPGEDTSLIRQEILTDRVLILFIERVQEDRKSCAVTDCNNTGANCVLILRCLLVPRECLSPEPNCRHQIEKPLIMPRLHTSETLRVHTDIHNPLEAIESTLDIRSAFGFIAKRMAIILATCLEKALKSIVGTSDETDETNSNETLPSLHPNFLNIDEDRAKQAIKKLYHADNPQAIFAGEYHLYLQYHYDFVHDLLCAYNEFQEIWCKIVKYCLPSTGYRQHVMICEMTPELDDKKYRSYFQPSPLRDANHEYWSQARKQFMRLVAMIEAFDVEGMAKLGVLKDKFPEIRVTPSRTGLFPVGMQALPFYYRVKDNNDQELDITTYWQPKACCTNDPLYSYHFHVDSQMYSIQRRWDETVDHAGFPLHFDLQKHACFRIEGHLGEHPLDVHLRARTNQEKEQYRI